MPRNVIAAWWASAASTSDSAKAQTPTRSADSSLAQAMRMRRGSRPKVTSPVRWLHSDVTARMPTTGRMSAIGIVVAWRYSPKECCPPSLKNMIVRAIAMIAPMPMSSQRPARVSSILRSSTWTRWSCRPLLSCGVGREVEEHLLETPAVGAAQLGQDDLVGDGDAADGDRLGLDLQAAGGRALRDDRLRGEGRHERVVVGGAGERAGAGEQLVLGALGDDLAVPDDDDLVGDALDLVEQVRGQQHRAALVGVAAEQVAHPTDTGRVEAVGRLVEDEHLGVAEEGVGDAEALAHAEGVVAHPPVRLLLGEADELDHL